MPTLGDSFSDDIKKEYVERNIAVGIVIKCFVKNTTPPKEKRFVVIGIDKLGNVIGSVFINSNINWNVIRTTELANLQHFVQKNDNDYLEWDSYIDCSDIKEIAFDEVYNGVINHPKNILGEVSDIDLSAIINNIKVSPKIAPKTLKRFKII